MRPSFWLILLVLITFASFYYYEKSRIAAVPEHKEIAQEKLERSAPPSTTNSMPPIKETHISPNTAPVLAMKVSPKTEPQYAQKPKDLYVHFDMIEGYAVAYGDTVLGKPTSDFSGKNGSAEIRPPRYWDHGVIPYLVKDDVVNPERIKNTIDYFNQNTSVRFVPFENQTDAIIFVKGEKNCSSFLGKTGGIQPVFLSEKCGVQEISHELMHALGFVHEQSRIDRDQFISILWENIEENFQSQYAMVPEPLMEPYYDSVFDPNSIMMYESHMFSIRPELETMKLKNGMPLGITTRKLSQSDIDRINRLYPKIN